MKLIDFITLATQKLREAGIDNPQLDVRWLVEHMLRLNHAQILSQSQRDLNESEIASLDALITRRVNREPVARIIGHREFWGLNFGLNEATLEPRPDSEILVETILSSFRRSPTESDAHQIHILDIGTGTGCLLLALLQEMPNARGVGIDISPRAVEQATKNALALELSERAEFRVGNWLDTINATFDIIISNPPYIRAGEIPALMPEVRDYDPMLALDGGEDGLVPYRFLIPQLKKFLNPNGLVGFEVGIGQAEQVVHLLQQNEFVGVEIRKDLGGVERCITASSPISR